MLYFLHITLVLLIHIDVVLTLSTQQFPTEKEYIIVTSLWARWRLKSPGSRLFARPFLCSGADQRKHQISATLDFVQGIHRWPVKYRDKRPVTRKMFAFEYVIMGFKCDPDWSDSDNTPAFQTSLGMDKSIGVNGGFTEQRTSNADFDVSLNELLNKSSNRWWQVLSKWKKYKKLLYEWCLMIMMPIIINF